MRKLAIFDLDGTLFETNARVSLYTNGVFEKQFKDAFEYHTHLKEDHHTYNYEEYISSKTFKEQAKPIHKMVALARLGVLSEDIDVVLVTARNTMDDMDVFKSVFETNNIDTSKMEFCFVGDLRDEYGRDNLSAPQAKKMAIDDYLSRTSYSYAVMYDDLESNLEAFLELREKYKETIFVANHIKLKA